MGVQPLSGGEKTAKLRRSVQGTFNLSPSFSTEIGISQTVDAPRKSVAIQSSMAHGQQIAVALRI